jgi:hypothetical protein
MLRTSARTAPLAPREHAKVYRTENNRTKIIEHPDGRREIEMHRIGLIESEAGPALGSKGFEYFEVLPDVTMETLRVTREETWRDRSPLL